MLGIFLCGFWPAVGLLFAFAVTGAWWSTPPEGNEWVFRFFAAPIFILAGAAVITPFGYARSLHQRLKQRDDQLEVINRELKHRIKNLFAVTSSISRQTIRSDTPRGELAEVIAGRIQAVAAAQTLLSIRAAEGSDLQVLVKDVVEPLSPSGTRLQVGGPAVRLPSDATTPFALILHELATNALKYGAWNPSSDGRVIIEWRLPTGRSLDFRWREDGVQASPSPVRKGFGSVLIQQALNQAQVRHEITSAGVDCQIILPI